MLDVQVIKTLQFVFTKALKERFLELDKFLSLKDSFSIFRMEDLALKAIPAYRQSNILMVFVKKGGGQRFIGHRKFFIRDNTLAVIPKNVVHSARYDSIPEGYVILFNDDFFIQQSLSYRLLSDKLVLNPASSPFILLESEEATDLSRIFEMMIEECNSQFREKKLMIAVKLLELLIVADRLFAKNIELNGSVSFSDLLQKFNALVEENYTSHRDVTFYAKELFTHPNHLNYIVKKETGFTAKQTIINRLMAEAKYLLASSDLSVKQVAYRVGFEDPNYFISFFKKYNKVTPAAFRTKSI